MKVYPASAIHNVAVVGHNGVGKTTLVSALLHEAGAVNRFGRVEDGGAPTDFDPEEIDRKISIGLAAAALEWKKKKVNLIDTPGYGIFVSEMLCGMRAADAVLLVVDAVAGIEVQTEKAWKAADELGLPRMIVVNRMDRERADGGRVMDQLQRKFGRTCVAKILDETTDRLPAAVSSQAVGRRKDGKREALPADAAGPPGAFVFKTISDPFSGRLTLFRVFSGTFKADGTYWNAACEVPE